MSHKKPSFPHDHIIITLSCKFPFLSYDKFRKQKDHLVKGSIRHLAGTHARAQSVVAIDKGEKPNIEKPMWTITYTEVITRRADVSSGTFIKEYVKTCPQGD